jgi:hypothetical protein
LLGVPPTPGLLGIMVAAMAGMKAQRSSRDYGMIRLAAFG